MKHLQRNLEAQVMTTETEHDTAQALAAALTAGEIEALRYPGEDMEEATWDRLVELKLVDTNLETGDAFQSTLGKRVLAVLDSAARPTVITAQQFVEQGYAAKIARGECVVKSPLYREEIISAEFIKPNSAKWDIAITDTKSTYRTYTTQELRVTWLPTATAKAADPTPASAARPTDTRPLTITAAELVENVEMWETRKDNGECQFLYNGNYIDGIGEFNDRYIIESGGKMSDHAFVEGNTVLQIEWLDSAAGEDWNAVIDDERLRIIKDAFDLSQPIAPAAIQLNIMHKEIVTLRAALETANAERDALRAALGAVRQTFVTIQAYPDTESEMETYHQIEGMVQQAVFGAEQATAALQQQATESEATK